MKLTLVRGPSNPKGTFGILFSSRGEPLCLTLELPWMNNERLKSCIPAGLYHFIPHNGTKFKRVWEAQDVPGRFGVLMHAGDTILDTEGCILVGKSLGQVNDLPGILESKNTLAMLRCYLPAEFDVEIIQPKEH